MTSKLSHRPDEKERLFSHPWITSIVEKPPENLSHIEIMYSQAADKQLQNICEKSAPRLPLKLRVEYRKILVAEFSLGLKSGPLPLLSFPLAFLVSLTARVARLRFIKVNAPFVRHGHDYHEIKQRLVGH